MSREVIIVADGKGGGTVEEAKCRSIVERENHGERERQKRQRAKTETKTKTKTRVLCSKYPTKKRERGEREIER